MDRCVNVREFLLRLYADCQPRKTRVSSVQVSFFLFLFTCKSWGCTLNCDRVQVVSLKFLFHESIWLLVCSSECENSRGKELCSFPEANLSLSTGERVSIIS